MSLRIGQAINGRELEKKTSDWCPERFASMCDSLAWAASGRKCSRLPSFTSRVNAKDGGVDAEWLVDIPENGHSLPTPILGSGRNVFQYKKRDLLAQDRRRVIASLKSSLKGAVEDVVRRDPEKQPPDRYVLFVNVDLKSTDEQALKESILRGYCNSEKLQVEIIGAATLAALLNSHPYLRAAYFIEQSFKTWEGAENAHKGTKFIGSSVELIGRETEFDQLRSFVDDPRVRVIILSGPHDIGKSRLALEATQHRLHEVVLALDPRSMTLKDYRDLGADQGETVCLVEDPEPDSVGSLVNESLSLPNLKLIITLPTSTHVPAPSYGYDERVQSFLLKPLSDENARKLLKATGQPFDFGIEDWIMRHAGGVPGVLLAAASAGYGLRGTLASFTESVGREFEKRIQERLGPEALKCARLLSILTHVGIAGKVQAELEHICGVFGDGWTPNVMLLALADLEQAGVARRGGSFAEITLPLLANYLVTQLLQGRPMEMFALFGRLDEPGQFRFLRRLSEVKSKEVEHFWDAMFAPDGPFETFQSTLKHGHLLQLVAGTVPDHTLGVLEQGLLKTTREKRLAIAGTQRRELMWVIEQLLFRRKTSRRAMGLLWLLAEAENERCGNNAIGVLAESFLPFHPQMPLPLRERVELLHTFLSEGVSQHGRSLVVKALAGALGQNQSFVLLRHSSSLEPLDSRPIFSSEEFYEYCRSLVDTLIFLARGEDESATEALRVLPQLTADMGISARPQDALERFRTLVDWARSGRSGLDVSSLSGSLRLMHETLSHDLEASELSSENRKELENLVAHVEQLKTDLETASFATRLKRWAGSWAHEEWAVTDDGASSHYEDELRDLAKEAATTPDLLSADLIQWLLSPAAEKAHLFFFYLGNSDEKLVFRTRIEELGTQTNTTNAFSSYWIGWGKRDCTAAENRLSQLADANAVTGEAIVQATVSLELSQEAIERVKTQIQAGRIAPARAGRLLLISQWMEQLTEPQFEQLLQTLVGENLGQAATVIASFKKWLYLKRPVRGNLADLAWRCLEHNLAVNAPAELWDFDGLAANLAQDDLDRGLRLLKKLLERANPEVNHWNPLDGHGRHRFWEVLYAKDKKRLIETCLEASRRNALFQMRIAWKLTELIDQEGDKELFLSFAKASIENARIIAGWTTSERPGFWPLAFGLVHFYPYDENLLGNLTTGLLARRGHRVLTSQGYETKTKEIEEVLQESSTPIEVRTWLRDVMGRLEKTISQQLVWEYDINVDDLRRHIQDKESAQRMWAIGRVLKYAKWEDIRRLLTVEDIDEALPQVDLPEKKRKMLERLIGVWKHGE